MSVVLAISVAQSNTRVPAGRLSTTPPYERPMVTIPGGWFYKGSTTAEVRTALRFASAYGEVRTTIKGLLSDWLQAEMPRRKIYLSTYRIDRYEVTRRQYARCVRAGKCRDIPLPSSLGAFRQADAPMVNVTWEQARTYCRFAGKKLPTEAQWEKAARGPYGRIWPWGSRWHERGSNHGTLHPVEAKFHASRSDGFFWVAPVRSYPIDKSIYGVRGLAGNVSEWVHNWYQVGHWQTQRVKIYNPVGPPTGQRRLIKGGSWRTLRLFSRGAARRWLRGERSPDVGFRCAR